MSENKMLQCGMWSLRHNKYECWYVKCFICDLTVHQAAEDKKRHITLSFVTAAPKTDTHTRVHVRGQLNPPLPTANRPTAAWGGARPWTVPANPASCSTDTDANTQPPAPEDKV